MIQVTTRLKVIDNSGARIVECIRILSHRGKIACVGDLIVVSIKEVRKTNWDKKLLNVKKGQIYKAVITTTKKYISRSNGIRIAFFDNTAILLQSNGTPLGTRIIGPVAKELEEKINKNVSYLKIMTLASNIY